MVLTLIFFLLLVNKKYGNENKRNLNKDGKIFIVIQIVFMEQWLFLRVSKVYQWDAEQFDGSSVDFFFWKKIQTNKQIGPSSTKGTVDVLTYSGKRRLNSLKNIK